MVTGDAVLVEEVLQRRHEHDEPMGQRHQLELLQYVLREGNSTERVRRPFAIAVLAKHETNSADLETCVQPDLHSVRCLNASGGGTAVFALTVRGVRRSPTALSADFGAFFAGTVTGLASSPCPQKKGRFGADFNTQEGFERMGWRNGGMMTTGDVVVSRASIRPIVGEHGERAVVRAAP